MGTGTGDQYRLGIAGGDHENRQKLLEELHERSRTAISSGGVVIAAGLADFRREQDRSLHDVFERADRLMYQDKQQLKERGARTR